MRVFLLLILTLIPLAGVAVAFLVPGWSDLLLVAGPTALAALILLCWTLLRPRKPRKWAILDGSNVMHWLDQAPSLKPVQDVIIYLEKRGYSAGVVFDANAGYLLAGKYQHDGSLALRLSIPEDNVLVVHKGEPADPRILAMARDMDAVVITEDRYRDWVEQFPEVQTKGHLVRGGYRDGKLWLDLPEDA